MLYEPLEIGNPYRKEYIDSLEHTLDKLREAAQERRNELFRKHFPGNAEYIRSLLREKLGWPLTQSERKINSVRKEYSGTRTGCSIYRLQYELTEGIQFYGILFVHEDGLRRPLIIAQHGGLGTPEVIGGLLEKGTGNYNRMVERLCELGANVFAPQLLLWNPQSLIVREKDVKGDVDSLRRSLDARLQQVGSSMTAIEIHCISCTIDHLMEEPFSQADHLGMAGLSYGGFYAMYTAAVDTRIRSTLNSCSFSEGGLGHRAGTDYIWSDSGNYFLDAEVALLVYPRNLCIQVAKHDKIIPFESSQREYSRFDTMARKLTGNSNWYVLDAFDGEHEFNPDDRYLQWLLDRC